MKVLTIDAHHNPQLLCHAVLERYLERAFELGLHFGDSHEGHPL
jgi:putative NADPH-quinone reductase